MNLDYIREKYNNIESKFNKNEIDFLINYTLENEENSENIDAIPLFSQKRLTDDFKANDMCFEFLHQYGEFNIIEELVKNNQIENPGNCLHMICHYLKEDDDEDINLLSNDNDIDISDIFITLANKSDPDIIHNGHLSLFFDLCVSPYYHNNQDALIKCCNFIINEKNIIPNTENYLSYLKIPNCHKEPDNFAKYFHDLKYNKWHLYKACFYQDSSAINYILGQKIIPNKSCFNTLFESYDSREINQEKENIVQIIDMFIDCGYELTSDDIILATRNRIMLYHNIFTENYIPTDEFYGYCDFQFQPRYNDNMFCDMLWLQKMCDIVYYAPDMKQIRAYMKKNKLEIDHESYAKLRNRKYTNAGRTKIWKEIIDNYEKKINGELGVKKVPKKAKN